jgi:hypothetical protein
MDGPEKLHSGIWSHDRVATGSDRAAGRSTRAVAVIVTGALLPWALLRRGSSTLVAALKRAAAVLGRAARRTAQVLLGL